MRTQRIYYRILFFIYICAFIFAVFMQNGRKNITDENVDALVNVVPLTGIINDIAHLVNRGLKGNMNLFINIIGNVILFIPLPIFLNRLYSIRSLVYTLLICMGISLWVEGMQYLFLLGVTDINDVLLNVLGAYLGWLITVYVFQNKCMQH